MASPVKNKVRKAFSYIRMSTEEQKKGDSWRRQLARSEAYVAHRGYELVDIIKDLGVSAFRGKNSEEGKLAAFLELVDEGRVDRDSVLIVESMDRLSRQNAMRAFALLTEIVDRGITIVTLDDGQEYSKDTLKTQHYTLMIALGAMIRSHDESKYKSQRVGAAWEQKKQNARKGHILTKQVPGWLRWVENPVRIEIVPERAELVRQIFRMTRDGWGAYSIARDFNARRVPTWSTRMSVWRESYIKKILTGRSVLGEYAPHKRVYADGSRSKRISDGDPIEGYYPPIVDQVLYREAAAAVAKRRLTGRGRKGPAYSNLFTGILKCGICGSGCRYINKGAPPKGGLYLICSVAHARGPCTKPHYRYQAIEHAILAVVDTLDIEYVLGGESTHRRLADLRHTLEMRKIDLEGIDTKIDRTMTVMLSDSSQAPLRLKVELSNLEKSKVVCEKEIQQIGGELTRLSEMDPAGRKVAVEKMLAQIRQENGLPKDELARRAIAEELRRLLDKVIIKPRTSLFFETIDEVSDWKSTYAVSNADELRQLFEDYPFEFVITYVDGETAFVDPVGGKRLRLRGNKMKLKVWREIAKSKSD